MMDWMTGSRGVGGADSLTRRHPDRFINKCNAGPPDTRTRGSVTSLNNSTGISGGSSNRQQIWSCSQQLVLDTDPNNNNHHHEDDKECDHVYGQDIGSLYHRPAVNSILPKNSHSSNSRTGSVNNGLSARVFPLLCLSPQDQKSLFNSFPLNRHRLSLGDGFCRSKTAAPSHRCRHVTMPHHASLRRAESSADSAIML